MIVKIGNKFTNSKDEPIMIILSEDEKELISNMGKQKKFVCFPEGDVIIDFNKRVDFLKDEEQLKKEYFK